MAMDHQQKYGGGYGGPSGGGVSYYGGPQHHSQQQQQQQQQPMHMAAPMARYNTDGNAGATTVPNFGAGTAVGTSVVMDSTIAPGPRQAGSPPHGAVMTGGGGGVGDYPPAPGPPGGTAVGGYYGAAPQPHGGYYNQGPPRQQQPMTNVRDNSPNSSSSAKKKEITTNDDEEPKLLDVFGALVTGISRKIVAGCGADANDSDNDDDETIKNDGTMNSSYDVGDGAGKRILVQNRADAYGNIYSGQLLDGKRDGRGTIFYAKSGDRYEGMWQGHQPHGDGRVIRGDGTGMFEGRWDHGVLQMVKNGELHT